MIVTRVSLAGILVALMWAAGSIALTASDELERAKELYRSAAYDEALTILQAIPAAGTPEATEVYEYRVFCLVALDRREDARTAIGTLVTANPAYAMSDATASPRVRTLFTEVRRALMPGIVQRAYADAKAAFEKKDPGAFAQFERVLTLLKDPDVVNAPGMADLATVVSGFRDLSKAVAAATPPPAAPTPPVETARPAPIPDPPLLVPPVAIAQPVPVPQIREEREWDGEVEVTINDRGRVIAARMTRPIHPAYDSQLLRAALNWTYKPALRDGTPVLFVKQITIHVDTRPLCGDRVTASCRPGPATR